MIIGLIGGLGPEATADYYRLLIERHHKRSGAYPQIIINSVNLTRVVDLITANQLDDLVAHLSAEVQRLADAGVQIGAISANTPHIVFDGIAKQSPIPLVSIVEAARDAASAKRMRRVGLLGTRFTMAARFFHDVFRRANIEVLTPPASEHDWIHDKYMNEMVCGIFSDATRRRFLELIDDLKAKGIDGVLLAGTELPLLLRGADAGIDLLDTTDIHVDAILSAAGA